MNWYKKNSVTHDSILDGVYIKPILSNDNIEVWRVDGKKIRQSLSVDFTLGGHDKVYHFIPKNEIWIDDATPKDEIDFVILHELIERRILLDWINQGKQNISYDEAHKQAGIVEVLCRKNKINVHEIIDQELEKNQKESKDCF
jgi:hypothetical protein